MAAGPAEGPVTTSRRAALAVALDSRNDRSKVAALYDDVDIFPRLLLLV